LQFIAFQKQVLSISEHIPLELSIPVYSEIQFRLQTISRTAKISTGSVQTIPQTAETCIGSVQTIPRTPESYIGSIGSLQTIPRTAKIRIGSVQTKAVLEAFKPFRGTRRLRTDFGCPRNGLKASNTDFGCPRNGLKAELYLGIEWNGELQRNVF